MMKKIWINVRIIGIFSLLILQASLIPFVIAAGPTSTMESLKDSEAANAAASGGASASTKTTTTSTGKCLNSNGDPVNGNCSTPTELFNVINKTYGDSDCTETLGGGSTSPNTITCTKKLFLGPCELLELAVRASERRGVNTYSDYACTAFPDPLPAAAIKSTPGSLCIVMDPTVDPNSPNKTAVKLKMDIVNPDSTKNPYCNAVAIKTGGGFGVIFNLVSYLFFFVQPILISVAVVLIISIGAKMMFSGGSGADAQKKIREQLIRVLTGLVLLFLIKLILVTINGGFFTN